MILIIDNYDSFTYNLVQEVGELGFNPVVYRNDAITVDRVKRLKPKKIIISPGPGTPEKAGISVELVKCFAGDIPILGVCLGHQAIGYAFGARIVRAARLMHGKTSFIYHDNKTIFKDVDNPFEATRYHSLIINRASLPDTLVVNAWTKKGEIMGVRHRHLPVEGVQFHPESFMTMKGRDILYNFLNRK